MKILIVDDNVAVQEIIQDILLDEGYAKDDVKRVSIGTLSRKPLRRNEINGLFIFQLIIDLLDAIKVCQ